jgi:hypothetical protein
VAAHTDRALIEIGLVENIQPESTPRLTPGGSGSNPTRSARLSRLRRYSIRALTRPRDHCPGNPLRPAIRQVDTPRGGQRSRVGGRAPRR